MKGIGNSCKSFYYVIHLFHKPIWYKGSIYKGWYFRLDSLINPTAPTTKTSRAIWRGATLGVQVIHVCECKYWICTTRRLSRSDNEQDLSSSLCFSLWLNLYLSPTGESPHEIDTGVETEQNNPLRWCYLISKTVPYLEKFGEIIENMI